ncbi:MAG: aldose 1-epimerase family protein [Clostridia bacterium]|nr:aldose 1-epimerase family protein [Clostridia bacterium]
MNYTIKSETLQVSVSDLGAELASLKKDGCEYLWQGNPEYWKGRAPVLFPICGRLFEGKYTYQGKTYEMILHGFSKISTYKMAKQTENAVSFLLESNEETKKQYPFDFALTVEYAVNGNTLTVTGTMENKGKEILPAAYGGHPGFNVPLDNGSFEDWYLEFSEECSPDRLQFSDRCLNTGKKQAFPLTNGKTLPLAHSLFAKDAIFLSRMSSAVTLKSDKSQRSVTVSYPDMPYLGFWHKPDSDAPYVCIEPWCGLPAFDGETDDFAVKNDMFRIPVGSSKTVVYQITLR